MAQVTVDYEEFAALKKRETDYKKMVEDLKKENQELKDTRKVIIRRRYIKKDEDGRIPLNRDDWEYYNVDIYVNFEDVKDDVRKHYQKELNAEIEHHRAAVKDYEDKKQSLKTEIEKSVKAELDAAIEKAKQMEDKYVSLQASLQPININLTEVKSQLENKMFPPRKEIASINEIIDNIEDKIHYGVNKVKHKSEEEIKEEEFVNCPWMEIEDVPYRR